MVKQVSAAAVEAVEEAERPELDKVELSNGIVLKVKAVPPFLLRQAAMNIARPQPPKIKPREDRDVEEENPDDPAHQEAMNKYVAEAAEAGSDLMMLAGSEVESLPDGRVPPESDDWLEYVRLVGIEVSDSSKGRYLQWLKFYALETEKDLLVLISALGQKIGLSEEEVSKTVDSFRSGKVGGADNGVSPEAAGDGHRVPPNRAQRRARGRGEGSS